VLLHGRQGTELELHLVGYQFPNERRDPWDSNSLLVSLRVLGPEGSCDVVDPCLTTWEADHLVRWLAAVATRTDILAATLNEPNVTFTGQAEPDAPERFAILACFALELRPPWLGSGNLCVDLDVPRAQLVDAATALRADLDRFPLRGDDPTL
jgi:hypothetical protein